MWIARDAVELNLSSEVDNIKNVQNKMLTTLDQVRILGLMETDWNYRGFFYSPSYIWAEFIRIAKGNHVFQ
jgi:hypothetical protein